MRHLTQTETRAINALKTQARHWPADLWLFAASGRLCVMRLNEKGERAMTPTGGSDPAYLVDHISIPCDGGDW